MMRHIFTAILRAALLAGALPCASFAQSTQPAPAVDEPARGTLTAARLQERLDEPISSYLPSSDLTVVLNNDLLIDVLHKLEGDRAHWLDLPGSTLSFLPYGERTRVSLRAPANTSIRKLLTLLLDSQSLTYTIIEDERGRAVLRVVPTQELARIGRRATIDEMQLLNLLKTMQVKDWSTPLAAQLSKAAGRTISFQFDLSGIDPAGAYRKLNDILPRMAPNDVAALLDQFCLQNNCVWRVEGNSIMIVDKIKQVMHQLQRHVSVRWSDTPLDEALTQIARSAGLVAQFQPGMALDVEAGSRTVNFQTPDESIVQIIERLAAKTGISYEVREGSIYFMGPRRMDPIVGTVTLPGKGGANYQLFIRRSLLSKQAQEALDVRLQQAADEMSNELTGPAPAKTEPGK